MSLADIHDADLRYSPLEAKDMQDLSKQFDAAMFEIYRRAKGITPTVTGKTSKAQEVVWSIFGDTYWHKAEGDGCFIF